MNRRPAPLSRRQAIEAEIERLIAMLDGLDPDPDLEPYLGWAEGEAASDEHPSFNATDLEEQHDCEMDECDQETEQWALNPEVSQVGPRWHGH